MAPETPPSRYRRTEDPTVTLDRNFVEQLQEVRVAETGVQILFAFLLAIAFQPAFARLSVFDKDVFVCSLLAAAVATALLITPVALHRFMFRRRVKDQLVVWTGVLSLAGLAFLFIAILAAVLLVLDVVLGRTPAIVATAILTLVFGGLWFVWPVAWLARTHRHPLEDEPAEITVSEDL
jgi:hypothetical protein